MASRYDALQTREDMNNPIRLQEDQDVASVQQYEYQDVSVASERSSVSIQQHEYQNFSVANENLVNAAQQHKNKDVQTTVVPAHKAEMHEGQPVTIVRRVGKWPYTLLVLSILGTAAFIIYITFLWFTASGNKNWKNIALSGWMTRSVAIAAVVLRTSTTVQAGLASSMLAAIALESTTGVALQDLAPLSLMRASSAAPLCLPTFHAYVFNISASSQAPLEEPTFFYDAERSQFRYDNIRKQLVSSSTLSLQERNVLSLHPQSWLLFNNMTNQDYPFGNIDTMITLTGSNQIFVPGQEHPTVHLMDDAKELTPRADRNIEGLGLEILQEGGTSAEAMQSILMSVVLADYQSYVFTEVPDGTPNSTVTLRGDFVTAQVPGGNGRPATNPAGATRSYVIVMITTAIHSVSVFLVFMLFIRSTKNTLIWESWHTIAQSMSAVTEPYLSQAGLATDSEVKKQMITDGTSNQAVSVKTDESGARAEVGVVRQRVKSSRVQKDSQSDLLMEELRPARSARHVERWNDRDTTNN
ncbi:unnamed protein product [Alternaria alternata]